MSTIKYLITINYLIVDIKKHLIYTGFVLDIETIKSSKFNRRNSLSTRATYLLPIDPYGEQSVCFYMHSDNYPEGAADYFCKMHCFKNPNDYYAGKFFRANEKAELTSYYDTHTDTEYHYHLNIHHHLTVLNRESDSPWEKFYEGPWYEFVNTQLPHRENLYLFETTLDDTWDYFFNNSQCVMTLTEAELHIHEITEIAKMANHTCARDAAKEIQHFQRQVAAIRENERISNLQKM